MTVDCVGYEDETLHDKAALIAQKAGFFLDKDAASCVYVSHKGIALKTPDFSPLYADFSASRWKKRRQEGKEQALIRACKPKNGLRIIDACAGWGKDAALLASFGAEVLMLERNPVMAILLEDALQRETAEKIALSLKTEDARVFLSALQETDYPDVIYIDPMHPERNKSALVKKEMQILQQMIGADEDALELIQIAISRAKQRVVVKWPQKKQPLLPAGTCINGKTIRFDIYPGFDQKI